MRDQLWLEKQLIFVRQRYFRDLVLKNPLRIRFGRASRTILGSIKLRQRNGLWWSIISINHLFTVRSVPQAVVRLTIAHELVHYLHGFSSQHEKELHYPHWGGVVDQELKKRGMHRQLLGQKAWVKTHWQKFVTSQLPQTTKRRRTRLRRGISWRSLW